MPTLSKLLNGYKEYLEFERGLTRQTIKAYSNDIQRLQAAIGDKDVADITLDDLRGHVREMGKSGLAVATVRRRIHSLNTFYAWLMLEGHVIEVISKRLHLPKHQRKQPVWLSDNELKRFAETKSQYGIAWLLLAWFGLRRSEVIFLDWRDVRMADNILIVRDTKSKDDRVMPIPAALKPTLWEAWHTAKMPVDGRVVPIGKSAFARHFKRHLAVCGLAGKGITPHTLRHSFASSLIRQGVSLPTVKELLGHKDVSTTMIYVHHSDKMLQEAMDKHVLGK